MTHEEIVQSAIVAETMQKQAFEMIRHVRVSADADQPAGGGKIMVEVDYCEH